FLSLTEDAISASVLELHIKAAEGLASEVEAYVGSVEHRLDFILGSIKESGSGGVRIAPALGRMVSQDPDILSVTVLGPTGKPVLRVGRDAGAPLTEPAAEACLKAERRACASPPAGGRNALLHIFRDMGNGVSLRLTLEPQGIIQAVEEYRISGSGYALAADALGNPLFYPVGRVPRGHLETLRKSGVLQRAVSASWVGCTETSGTGGDVQIAAYAPIPAFGGAILTQQPKAEAFILAHRMRWMIAAAVVLATLAAFVLALVLSRRLILPLLALVDSTKALARGDYPAAVRVRSQDELQDLTDAFNDMTAKLRETDARICAERRQVDTVLRFMRSGAVLTDQGGRVLLSNEQARTLLETPLQRGSQVHEAFSRLKLDPEVQEVFSSTAELIQVMASRKPPDERYLQLEIVRLDQSRTGDGHSTGNLLWTITDVTGQQIEQHMVRDFLSLISHKVRTPISLITGNIQLLLQNSLAQSLTQMHKSVLETIQRQSMKLNHHMNRLLVFVSLSKGADARRAFERVRLPEVVQDAVSHLDKYLQENHARVDLALAVPGWVDADSQSLREVVLNLTENAVKFNRNTEKRVSLAVKESGGEVVLSVIDDGPGIPSYEHEKIFQKFYQVDPSFTGQIEGWGLGLAYVKSAVERFGGTVKVVSPVGKGAEFIVTFPASRSAPPA
ncbi:MAG: ATP-binding protein, partial [Candidatus Methylomirabilota bacterium]